MFPLSDWLQFGGEGGGSNTGGAHLCSLHTAQHSCFSALLPPLDANSFLPKKRNKLDRKWRPDQQAGKSWISDFPSEERHLGPRAGRKSAGRSVTQPRWCRTCVRVFIRRFPWKVSGTRVGPGGSPVGGLRLTPGALRGYSAPAFCQILGLSHSRGLTGC